MVITPDIEKFDETLSEDSLIEIIQARRDKSSVLRALKLYARMPTTRRKEILGLVLEDPEQSVSARRTVARMLGTEPKEENQSLLLRQLKVDDPLVQGAVAESLGRIGDEKVLEALENIETSGNRQAATRIDFAKTLLSYRYRLDRNLMAPPDDTKLIVVGEAEAFQVTKADPDTVAEAVQDVKNELPAVPLAVQGAVTLTCRSMELLLVVAEAFRLTRPARTIRTRSALPLVLLKKGLSLERFALANYFFTQPSKTPGTVELIGTRPSGALTYAGKVKVTDDGFAFVLKSVDSRYAPAIDLEGIYNPRKRSFEFSRALASTRVVGQENRATIPSKVNFSIG